MDQDVNPTMGKFDKFWPKLHMEREKRKGEQMIGRGEEVMRSERGQDRWGEGRRKEKGNSEEGEMGARKERVELTLENKS